MKTAKKISVFVRDHFRCYICDKKCFYSKDPSDCSHDRATIDHVVPTCKNGSSEKENLKTCCFYCNSRKGKAKLSQKFQKQMLAERKSLTIGNLIPKINKSIIDQKTELIRSLLGQRD